MSGVGSRPDLRRLSYDQFLYLFPDYMRVRLEREVHARNVWKRLVEVVKGAVYNTSNAIAETLTFGQIVTVATNGHEQFPGMSDERWNMVLVAAARINAELPGYTNSARCFEMLKDFVEQYYPDSPNHATKLWTVLVREGLGISLGASELMRVFWVPDSVIVSIAASDPGEYRNLGGTLIGTLRAWCETF